jgi:hypothetical protein
MIALRKTYQGEDLLANKFIIKKNNFVRKPASNYENKMKNTVDPLEDLDDEELIKVEDNTSKEGSVYDIADIPFEKKARRSVDGAEEHNRSSKKSKWETTQERGRPATRE